jgi:hypothetical protein
MVLTCPNKKRKLVLYMGKEQPNVAWKAAWKIRSLGLSLSAGRNCREVLIARGFEEEKSQEDSVLLDYIARVGIARRVGVQDIAG